MKENKENRNELCIKGLFLRNDLYTVKMDWNNNLDIKDIDKI